MCRVSGGGGAQRGRPLFPSHNSAQHTHPNTSQQPQAQYLHQFVLHASLDAVDEAMWATKDLYLKVFMFCLFFRLCFAVCCCLLSVWGAGGRLCTHEVKAVCKLALPNTPSPHPTKTNKKTETKDRRPLQQPVRQRARHARRRPPAAAARRARRRRRARVFDRRVRAVPEGEEDWRERSTHLHVRHTRAPDLPPHTKKTKK